MIDHVWTVLAQNCLIDRDSNNLSFFNVLEQVQVSNRPGAENEGYRFLGYELVTLWSRRAPDAQVRAQARVLVLSPTGEPLTETEYDVDLTEFQRIRHRMRFVGIPAKGPGRYQFVTQYRYGEAEWEQVSNIPLTVIVEENEEE